MPPVPEPGDLSRRPRPSRSAPVWAEPPPEAVLRRMVGAASEGSLEQLRTAYDLAVHRATRSGDHQHALALSRAYDRLPVTTRERLYPSSVIASGSVRPYGPGRTRAAFVNPSRRRRNRRPRGFWPRVIVWGTLGLAVACLAAAGAVAHYRRHPSDLQPPRQPVGRPGYSTAPAVVGGAAPVIVPTSAPTGANGLVTLLCQPRPGSAGYAMTAPRGAVVMCTNGAVPAVIG